MVVNRSSEKILLTSVLVGRESGGIIFTGPRGTFKVFSCEVVIDHFLRDYRSYIPFNHSDIFVVGPYYYEVYYKFFAKNFSKVIANEKLRDLFIRFVGFSIANRGLALSKEDVSNTFYLVNTLREGNIDKKNSEELLSNLGGIVSRLAKIESIGIDAIREVILFASRTSLSGYKFVIISEFDRATVEAQNAFLKVLEEPPKGVFFILTTPKYEKILPTVRSRAIKVTFPKIKGEELKVFFSDILSLNEGGYYSFYDLLLEDVYKVNTEFFSKVLDVMFSGDLTSAMDFVEEVAGEEVLVEKFFELASRTINVLLEARAKASGLDVTPDVETLAKIPEESLQKFTISRLHQLQSFLDECYTKVYVFNFNPKFVLTNFFLEVFS